MLVFSVYSIHINLVSFAITFNSFKIDVGLLTVLGQTLVSLTHKLGQTAAVRKYV